MGGGCPAGGRSCPSPTGLACLPEPTHQSRTSGFQIYGSSALSCAPAQPSAPFFLPPQSGSSTPFQSLPLPENAAHIAQTEAKVSGPSLHLAPPPSLDPGSHLPSSSQPSTLPLFPLSTLDPASTSLNPHPCLP